MSTRSGRRYVGERSGTSSNARASSQEDEEYQRVIQESIQTHQNHQRRRRAKGTEEEHIETEEERLIRLHPEREDPMLLTYDERQAAANKDKRRLVFRDRTKKT